MNKRGRTVLADYTGMHESTARLVWAVLALVFVVVVLLPWLVEKMRRK